MKRVGVIFRSNNNVVDMLGFGTHEGDQPCPILDGLPNPKIVLDTGEVYWGCEVWWGSEAKFREKFFKEGVTVNFVDRDGNPRSEVPEGWRPA